MTTATQTIRFKPSERIEYLSMPAWLEDGLFCVTLILLCIILLAVVRNIALWRRHRARAARGFEVSLRQ